LRVCGRSKPWDVACECASKTMGTTLFWWTGRAARRLIRGILGSKYKEKECAAVAPKARASTFVGELLGRGRLRHHQRSVSRPNRQKWLDMGCGEGELLAGCRKIRALESCAASVSRHKSAPAIARGVRPTRAISTKFSPIFRSAFGLRDSQQTLQGRPGWPLRFICATCCARPATPSCVQQSGHWRCVL